MILLLEGILESIKLWKRSVSGFIGPLVNRMWSNGAKPVKFVYSKKVRWGKGSRPYKSITLGPHSRGYEWISSALFELLLPGIDTFLSSLTVSPNGWKLFL